jgi:poly(3-hydroxybutyrate) depolymerase
MGDTPDAMAAYTELDRVAVNEGFVLVYPSARRAMWSTVGVRQDNLAQNADVQFFDEILERVCSTYDVDRDRVYGVGMSNGATFVQILAHAMPSTLAAIVAHSGMRPLDIETPASLTPLLLIVGSDDTAPRRIKEDFDHYRSNGHNARLIVVDGLEHRWSTCHNATMWNFLAKHDVRE